MIGRIDDELFGETLGKKYLADDTRVICTGKPILNDHDLILTADGVPHDIVSSKFPILGMEGQVIGLYGVSRDVTHTSKTEPEHTLLPDKTPGGILS